MESKDDQAQQPDFKGRPLPVLRRQEPADQPPQPGEPDFEPLPLPVPHMMRVNRATPKLKPFDESEIPAFLRNAKHDKTDKGSW